MTGETEAVLDLAQVAELMALDQGRGAMFARFVDMFVSKAGERIAQLGRHADSADSAGLASAAHSLRGATGNVGGIRMAALLERIEVAAKRGDLGAARELLPQLDAEYASTRTALLSALPAKQG